MKKLYILLYAGLIAPCIQTVCSQEREQGCLPIGQIIFEIIHQRQNSRFATERKLLQLAQDNNHLLATNSHPAQILNTTHQFTLAHLCVIKKHLNLLMQLISQGELLCQRNSLSLDGSTALLMLCKERLHTPDQAKRLNIVYQILQKEPGIALLENVHGQTCIHAAIISQDLKLLKLLASSLPSNIAQCDNQRKNIMHYILEQPINNTTVTMFKKILELAPVLIDTEILISLQKPENLLLHHAFLQRYREMFAVDILPLMDVNLLTPPMISSQIPPACCMIRSHNPYAVQVLSLKDRIEQQQ